MQSTIEVVLGPMFAGKTERILSEASKHRAAGRDVLAFKPKRDTRASGRLYSRVGTSIDATEVSSWREIVTKVVFGHSKPALVVIDEMQFMPDREKIFEDPVGSNLYTMAGRILWEMRRRRSYEISIMVAGLLFTTEHQPFDTMQSALTVADTITHLTAFCKICGNDAPFTICTQKKGDAVLIGDAEIYEARCGRHLVDGNPNWDPYA